MLSEQLARCVTELLLGKDLARQPSRGSAGEGRTRMLLSAALCCGLLRALGAV